MAAGCCLDNADDADSNGLWGICVSSVIVMVVRLLEHFNLGHEPRKRLKKLQLWKTGKRRIEVGDDDLIADLKSAEEEHYAL